MKNGSSNGICALIGTKFEKFKMFVNVYGTNGKSLSLFMEMKNKTTVNWPEPIERHLLKVFSKMYKRLFGLNHISDIY